MTDPKSKTRVLIAEDDAIIRMDLKEMLEEEDYEVLEAGDGAAAVQLARDEQPSLVILDIKMPVMDGLAAAQKISEERLAPVLILTAYSQRELVERAAQIGAMAFLVKPFQKQDLLPAIEIAKGRYQQLASLADEVGDLTERLESRKQVERAKGILIDRYGMNEGDAFRFLQQAAMDRRLSMREVAEAILSGSVTPSP
ncbi:MAG: response regulator [Actinobacteria bacterium]|nr:MAG: response regulator [Actinomycetota bacterium]